MADRAYYRVIDSMENFKIKVGIREVSRLSSQTEEERKPFEKEIILSWQEKVHGPADIADYLHYNRDKNGAANPSQKESRRELEDLVQNYKSQNAEQNGNDGLLQPTMLYSYINRDQCMVNRATLLHDSTGKENYVGNAIHMHGIVKQRVGKVSTDGDLAVGEECVDDDDTDWIQSRTDLVGKRENRGRKFKTMHICLATDVDTKKISNDEGKVRDNFTEHILCSFKLYQDGGLEVSPALSMIQEENAIDGNSSRSLFMENKTVQAGLSKGFKLRTFRLQTEKGAEYEYVVENINELTVPEELEQIRVTRETQEASAVQRARGTDNWRQDGPEKTYEHSTAINGEIVSCTGFEGGRFFISYQIVMPDGWRMRVGNINDGYTQDEVSKINMTREDGSKLTGADILNNDGYFDGQEASGILNGVTQTAIARQVRNDVTFLSKRRHYRGRGVPYTTDSITRTYFAVLFFIVSVIAVLLGPAYPFWIIPAVVVLFTLMTGLPGGPQSVLLTRKGTKDDGYNKVANQASKGNTRALTDTGMKIARATGHGLLGNIQASNREFTSPHLVQPVAYFGHLIGASFDVKAQAELSAKSLTPSAEVPSLLVQVYQVSATDRLVLEGYGYTHLNDDPGEFDIEIKCWKPVGDNESKCKEYFIGGALRLKSVSFVDVPNKYGGKRKDGMNQTIPLSRFGMQSEASGTVRFRYNTIITNPNRAQKSRPKTEAEIDSESKRKTVEEILTGYRNSMQFSRTGSSTLGRSAVLSSSIASSVSGNDGGISKVLGSTATSNASRVAELLARQRAKAAQSKSMDSKLSAVDEEKKDSFADAYPSEDKYSVDDSAAPLLGRGGRMLQSMKPLGGERSSTSRDEDKGRDSRYEDSDDEGAGLLSKSAEFKS